MTIKEKVIQAFTRFDVMTACGLARQTGVRIDSLSSQLIRLTRDGTLIRVKGVGPRGGYGYTLADSVAKALGR